MADTPAMRNERTGKTPTAPALEVEVRASARCRYRHQ